MALGSTQIFFLRVVFSCNFGGFHGGATSPCAFLRLGPVHMPIVPMSVKAPVVASTVYIEILLEKLFAT
jgi:hypothetical protein